MNGLDNVCDAGCLICEVKVSIAITHFPPGARTHDIHISDSNGQYLNVRHCKLGTIIIQTTSISYSMIVRT
jgi:hypothetical protein